METIRGLSRNIETIAYVTVEKFGSSDHQVMIDEKDKRFLGDLVQHLSDWRIVKYLGAGHTGRVYKIEPAISGVLGNWVLKVQEQPNLSEGELGTIAGEL